MTSNEIGKVSDCYEFTIKSFKDVKGSLGVIEKSKEIPFIPKRTYYLYGVPKESIRGCHAHKNLQQVLFCPNGSCRVKIEDRFGDNKIIYLNKPDKGLYVTSMIWRELDEFKKDTVFVCCASNEYNVNDYIRSKEQFLKIRGDFD